MNGASKINQFRFHMGFHYPRSQRTIKEIKSSYKLFLNFYSNRVFESFFFSAELLHEQDALQREFHDFFDGVELFYASLKNHDWRKYFVIRS